VNETRTATNDLVLAPGEYAYMQSTTNGDVRTIAGPSIITQTGNDRPVQFDPANRRFNKCNLEQAVMSNIIAAEGDYIVLTNPTGDGKHPTGSSNPAPNLLIGQRVNIPGPATFALYPGQIAEVIEGHQLRSNQYLICRIYNEEKAKENWDKQVIKTTTEGGGPTEADQGSTVTTTKAEQLIQGQLFIVKGTEVSFYIPPTGIEVLPDDNEEYVRQAVTLEQLEYAILVDENGQKRYERGPQVVFPKPTERFNERTIEEEGEQRTTRRFRAIELNAIQGLNIKVIAPYEEDGETHEVGEEFFLTGKEQAIYFPRPEHSIVTYGEGNTKHFATAVPKGQARYIMDRNTGDIRKEVGPKMLLPNPINEVQVRRILTDRQVKLWYPTNTDALAYNQQLRVLSSNGPRGQSGMITEQELAKQASFSNLANFAGGAASYGGGDFSSLEALGATQSTGGALRSASPHAAPQRQTRAAQAVSETFNRGQNYTPPRMVTIDSRFEGAPSIEPYTGYAVMVVSKSGGRRVVEGPQSVLLEYDETLEVLQLSTGKPKTTDKLKETVYLRVTNNKVSDIIEVETSDHVTLTIKPSYRVNFEGETPQAKEKWFSVENYVKFLCDHARSILKGTVKKLTVQEFYNNSTAIIRDALLGTATNEEDGRPGMLFKENSMRVTDVEVLGVTIKDEKVNQLLSTAQFDVISQDLNLGKARKALETRIAQEKIDQDGEKARAETDKIKTELAKDKIGLDLELIVARAEAAKQQAETNLAAAKDNQNLQDFQTAASLAREKKTSDQALAIIKAQTDWEIGIEKERQAVRVEMLQAEVDGLVKKFTAISPSFVEALLALGTNDTLEKVAKALSVQSMLGGESVVDVLQKAIGDGPITNQLASLFTSVAGQRGTSLPLARSGAMATAGDGR
jgi:major vault protein